MRALLVCLLLAFPVSAQEAEPEAPPPQTIDADADASDDAAIERRLEGILEELDGYGNVGISVSGGVVTLSGEVIDGAALDRLEEIAGRVDGVVAVENEAATSADVAERLDPAVRRLSDRFWQGVAFLPLLGVALLIFLAIAALGWFVASRSWPWDRLAPNRFVANIYRQLVRIAFTVIGLVIALDLLNAVALLGTLLGAAGIFGLALGFAVRDTVENFIASVLLSFRQPFAPGDLVEIEGDEGKVIRLTSRATVLLGLDGNQIAIPNATVYSSRLINKTRNPERRFRFEIGVASDADLAAVRDLITETVAGLPFTLTQPEPLIWIDRIGDGAIFLQVTGWIDQRETNIFRAQGEALRVVKETVEAAGVEVPDTTYRIALQGAGGLKGALVTADDDGDRQGSERPEGTPAPRPAPVAVADVSAGGHDAALDRIVAAERRAAGGRDLLAADAPLE